MDCLSYFSNSSDLIQLQDCFIPDLDTIIPESDSFFFQPQPQYQDEAYFGFNHYDHHYLPPQETFLPNPKPEDSYFEDSFDLDSFLHTPKYQKLDNSSFHFNDPFLPDPNPDSYITDQASNFQIPDFSPTFKVGWSDGNNNKKPELSAQSIAARKRRRRITEKTQELGKLIPGSEKHNTAEMFQAAAKYVKFMQAQIEILKLKQSKMQIEESPEAETEMQFLLASQGIQEKLSTEEVCVVSKEMVQVLKSEECILRNPKISQELMKLC